MLVILVNVHVKSEQVDAFIAATVENASQSLKESGIAHFDLVQHVDEPTKFSLLEVYRNEDAPALHKETAHYLRWRDTVAPMMAEPRQSVKYNSIFPADENW